MRDILKASIVSIIVAWGILTLVDDRVQYLEERINTLTVQIDNAQWRLDLMEMRNGDDD